MSRPSASHLLSRWMSVIVVLFCIAGIGTGQPRQALGADPPVRLDTERVDKGSQPRLSVKIRNLSGKSIVGIVLRVHFDQSNGVSLSLVRSIFFAQRDGAVAGLAPGTSKRPGKEIDVPLAIDTHKPFGYQVSVDVVVFEDESVWGPRKLQESARLISRVNTELMPKPK